jgi:hypothetical protein
MNIYGGVDVYIHVSVTPHYLYEWSASRPVRFIPGTVK